MDQLPKTIILGLLSPDAAAREVGLRQEWEALLPRVNALNRFYSSPGWFFHRTRAVAHESDRIAVIRNGDARVLGVCPLDSYLVNLTYFVKKRSFGASRFRAALVMGSEFMLTPDQAAHAQVISGLFKALPWCECIALASVPRESFTWQFLEGPGRSSPDYFSYVSDREPRTWRYIELGKTFDEYLNGLKSKSRTNIKAKVRKFLQKSPGKVDCKRVQNEGDVDWFHSDARRVAEQSWRHRSLGERFGHPSLDLDSLKDLARSGMLRAYLLSCDSTPLAYVVGYQLQGVYQYAETAFSEEFSDRSPGIALLYMLLEDLHSFDRPDFFNFGTGDGYAKRLFANRTTVDNEVLLVRRTLRNRLRVASHRSFRGTLWLAKRLLNSRRSKPQESVAE